MKEKVTVYSFMHSKAKVEDLHDACVLAQQKGYDGLCVPQWFVSYLKKEWPNSFAVTVVGLPGGMTNSFSKYAEAKIAVANGADVVVVPVNMDMCNKGNFQEVKKDFVASAAPAIKQAKAAALIDASAMAVEKLASCIDMLIEEKADFVLLENASEEIKDKLSKSDNAVGFFGIKETFDCALSVVTGM